MCYLWCLCTWLRIKLCVCDCMFCVMLCGVVFIGLFVGGYCVCWWWLALTLNCWVGVELCCLLYVSCERGGIRSFGGCIDLNCVFRGVACICISGVSVGCCMLVVCVSCPVDMWAWDVCPVLLLIRVCLERGVWCGVVFVCVLLGGVLFLLCRYVCLFVSLGVAVVFVAWEFVCLCGVSAVCNLLRRFVDFFVLSRVLVVYLRNSASVLSNSCCAVSVSHFDFKCSVLC